MRTRRLLLALLCLTAHAAYAQQAPAAPARIESSEVLGIPLDQLSPGLRQEIDALAGSPFDDARVDALASRIEMEHPDVVAAVRAMPRDSGIVHVVFIVARIDADEALQSNINARYTIESVAVSGVADSLVSQPLRDALQGLVGKRLDPDEAERLEERLSDELTGFAVERRVSRGSEPGRVRLVFEVSEVEPPGWVPFLPSRSKLVYHGDQGWSGVIDIPITYRSVRFNAGFVADNGDDLVEEYSGARFRIESRRLGTDRLGASLEVSKLQSSWRPETLTALALDPGSPEIYRSRLSVEPTFTVAFAPVARVTAGVNISELESQSRAPESQMANAFVLAFGYGQRWTRGREVHRLDGSYQLRRGADALESDFAYTRRFGNAAYRYERRQYRVAARAAFGYLSDGAPLFERFTLGDSSTLRGWNKFDIAPAGGSRMFHQALEFTYHHVGLFVDAGSVWSRGDDVRVRYSTGFGYLSDNGFLTVGFPLNADGVGAAFMMGVRF